MDRPRGLIAGSPTEVAEHAADCPDCGAPSAQRPSIRTAFLGGVPIRRCFRCGRRSSSEPAPRRILTCHRCHLPFLEEAGDTEQCGTCRAGAPRPDLMLADAAESEVRVGLATAWEFVGAPETSDYLRRVLRQVASRIDGAPRRGHVALVRESARRTLALPSGTVVLSTGALGGLENEAELAFLLGHELAHVAAGHAAAALAGLGLFELAAHRGDPGPVPWTEAALDLVRLGHGDRAEHAADAVALEAMTALGYETGAALGYLERLRESTDAGRPEVADLALAHPPPADRIRRVEARGNRRLVPAGAGRVDREVFRRAAGHGVIASRLAPVRPFEPDEPGRMRSGLGLGRKVWLWAGVALGLVALALWALL